MEKIRCVFKKNSPRFNFFLEEARDITQEILIKCVTHLASYDAEKAAFRTFADVENALVARRKLAEKTAAEARLVRAGKEYARLAQLQYDGGYAPYSTVLQAQQQLFPAELTYAQTRASLFSAMVDIYKALGGGWVRAADRMTKASE